MPNDRHKLTPPELANAWGIGVGKILAWIRSGELRAVNIARHPCGRPRWLIDRADVLAFEERRAAISPAPRTRRRIDSAVIQFF